MRCAITVYHIGRLVTRYRQQIAVRTQISKREFRHAGLSLAQKFARAAQFQITFRNHKPVIGLTHHIQTLGGKIGQGRRKQQQAG